MLTVLSPGARTLIQDRGRPGYEHLGVPTSGPADPRAHALAHALVDNPATDAALEVALHGPTLRFERPAVVAYAGAAADLNINGAAVPSHHTLHLSTGDILTVGALRDGVYGYLAIAGGLNSAPVLGSQSTCTLSGLGPEPVGSEDVLTWNAPGHTVHNRAVPPSLRDTSRPAAVRFTWGPHADLFTPAARLAFQTGRWLVDPRSSRVGVRLGGTPLAVPDLSLPSLGMVTGAVQVPPSGEPIVLGPDHGTTGGYPVVAVIEVADMPVLMQSRPGQGVAFIAQTAPAEPEPPLVRALLDLDAVSA